MDPERVRRELYRGISPARVCAIFASSLDRELKAQGAEALFAVSDALQGSLSDPGLPALGGWERGLAGLDGTGVQLGLVGRGWDRTHPAFASAALTLDDALEPYSRELEIDTELGPTSIASSAEVTSSTAESFTSAGAPEFYSPWSGLDTAVLSQIAAVPLPAQEMTARPALGPTGIAPSAQITLFAAELTATALASAIDRASTALGTGAVLLVPRTCVGVVRGPGVHALVDLPLPANREIHAALLRAREAGLVVIVPAGIGGRNLASLPFDDFLIALDGSPPAGFSSVSGPAAELGVAARLAECSSAGVLVVGGHRRLGPIAVPA